MHNYISYLEDKGKEVGDPISFPPHHLPFGTPASLAMQLTEYKDTSEYEDTSTRSYSSANADKDVVSILQIKHFKSFREGCGIF